MPTLQEICDAVGGELHGDGAIEITGVQSLDDAGAHDLAPFDDPDYIDSARSSAAGGVIVTAALAEAIEGPRIVHGFPVFAMNAVIEMLGMAPIRPPAGRHPTATIDPAAQVPESCSIGPNATIGPDARLGERCVVRANVTIEAGAIVGDDCIIDHGAVLHEGAVLGHRVTIGTGSVISRQGFGFTPSPRGPVQIHHVGRVEIGDDSAVGACCSIDRARFGATRIGKMSGLDFGVHLGHNSSVGDRSYVAAQTGLAGHGFIGNDCIVAGQVGIGNHCGVGDGSRVGGQAGVTKKFGAGHALWSTPAVDIKLAFKMSAALRRIAKGKGQSGK